MNINITILGQAISFVIFVAFCMKYVWEPIMSIIAKRQKLISDTFANAERSKKISETMQIEANNYLNQAKHEAELIIKKANQYRIELVNESKHLAESEKKKILFQARQIAFLERKRIAEELQKRISTMVITGVERIIECSVDKYVDRIVVDKIIHELQDNK